MKRVLLISLAAVLAAIMVPYTLLAQDITGPREGAVQLLLMGGTGIPLGDFSSSTLSDPKAGFARPGWTGAAEFTVETEEEIELGIFAGYTSYSLDETAMEGQFRSMLSSIRPEAGNASELTFGSWKMLSVMLSAGFCASHSHTIQTYGRLYLGVLSGTSPELTATVGTEQFVQESAAATTFGYGAGIGIVFGQALDIGIRFIEGEPEYNLLVTGGGDTWSGTSSQPTTMVTFCLGYVLNFQDL